MGSNRHKQMLPLLRRLLIGGVLMVSGCGPANETAVDTTLDTTSAGAHEQLWLTPPKGWVLTANANDSVRHVRYLDPAEPTQSLTVESRPNTTLGTPAADPLDLIEQLAENERQDCAKAEDFNTFTGYEHGYATAVRLFICQPDDLTTGQLTLLKIMQGQQQTYLVALEHQWSNTTPNTAEQTGLGFAENSKNIVDRVAVWSLYLRGVRVCAASGCQQQTN